MLRGLKDTKVIDLYGAQFFLKTLDERIFRKLSAPIIMSAKAGNGEDAAEIAANNSDILFDAFYELVKYGVMGHANFKTKDGLEEFKAIEGDTLSDDMMSLYSKNRLISTLGSEIFIYNHIGEEERKN